MKRTPLSRRTPLKRGGPLRVMSLKRLRERPQREAVIAEVIARDGPGCYAQRVLVARLDAALENGWPLTCAHPPGKRYDAHEIQTRARRPGAHLDASNVRLVCRKHHDWIDTHQITATTLGLLRPSWTD
jgi:hypothetical protein